MLQNIDKLTSAFSTISLSEMENVTLLDRTDKKFYFKIEKLENVLSKIVPFYRLLEVNGISLQRYVSPYYDTEKFALYNQHQNGIQNRFKIRFRNYVDSQLCFFEIKHKNNKGRTIKHRLNTAGMGLNSDVVNFLIEKTPMNPSFLNNKLTVTYSRLTFVNTSKCERVTLDLLLSCNNKTDKVDFSNLVIAEVKQDKSSFDSEFIKVMNQQKIKEGGISKYCLGIALLYSEVKKNLFKEQINTLKKIIT